MNKIDKEQFERELVRVSYEMSEASKTGKKKLEQSKQAELNHLMRQTNI